MRKNYRIENPKEEFRKILHTKLGKHSHEYFGFHGEFKGPEPCEKPKIDRELPPTYLNYNVTSKKYGNYIHFIFYEDSQIDKEYINKIYNLSMNFACPFKKLPSTHIITKLPLEKCVKKIEIGSIIFCPVFFSFADYDSIEHFNKIKEKIANNEEFSNVEALDILFIVENSKTDKTAALKNVCNTINQMKINDKYFKADLKEAMKYVIHEYAESVEEIKKLEKIVDGN